MDYFVSLRSSLFRSGSIRARCYVPSAKLRKNARYNGVVARNPRRHETRGLRCLLTFTGQSSMRLGRSIMRKGQRLRRGEGGPFGRRGVSQLWRMLMLHGGTGSHRSRLDESIGAPAKVKEELNYRAARSGWGEAN